jgi:tetratricopeptide (TPR) repeat protein
MSKRNPRQAKLDRKAKKAAKYQRRKKGQQRGTAPSLTLLSGLDEAEQLLEEDELDNAVEVLKELAKRYPRRWEVLHLLREAHLRQEDMWSYQTTCQRLIDLDSQDADSWYALGGAALENGQLALAHHAFSHFLSRWPDHRHADGATRTVRSELADYLQTQLADLKVPDAEAFELLVLHDKINLHLHLGEDEPVISLAGQLLARCPTFAPALNNRSLAHFRFGNYQLAVADARLVLEFDPANFHALGNLARFLYLSGEFEEARAVADRLKTVESDSPDLFTKQAEAFSYLGDWTAVLDVLHRAETSQAAAKGANMGMLYHVAGVAAAELGQLDTARKHWKRAVKLDSVAEWAQDNLNDLKQPPGQQNGPWAFPMNYWVPGPVIDRLRVDLERRAKSQRARSPPSYAEVFRAASLSGKAHACAAGARRFGGQRVRRPRRIVERKRGHPAGLEGLRVWPTRERRTASRRGDTAGRSQGDGAEPAENVGQRRAARGEFDVVRDRDGADESGAKGR